jgi:BASS family bile acid:Na+ symporter
MGLLQALSQQAAFINAEVIPWVLRLVMVGLGLSLTMGDFKRVVVFPKAATIGLVTELVGTPLMAFVVAWIFQPPPIIAIGLVILAACPSGVTSNAYTFAAKADVPLCVTLSAITSVVTVFSIPFLINLALQTFGDEGQLGALPVLPMLIGLISYTLVPLVIGMIIRAQFETLARRAEEPLRKGVLYLMMGVLVLGVISSYRQLIDHAATAGLLVATMNLASMSLGYGVARLFGLPVKQAVTMTFEVGVQNLALSFAINFNMLNRPDFAVAGLVYAAIMPATALAFVAIGRRLIEADERAAARRQEAGAYE